MSETKEYDETDDLAKFIDIGNNTSRKVCIIILITIFIIGTGLIFLLIPPHALFVLIALPFAIKSERQKEKFVFLRFIKHLALGPYFLYKYATMSPK